MFNANDLINTRYCNPNDISALMESLESWAYYEGVCYPKYNFGPAIWRSDTPLPTPTRHVKIIVDETATFTVRNSAPTFSVPENEKANIFLQEVIKANYLDSQWIALGIDLANTGSMIAKFNYDPEDTDRPVSIAFLNVPQQARIFCDPSDHTKILMLRIQYPYRDARTGQWMMFREEWTRDLLVKYHEEPAGDSSIMSPFSIPGYLGNLGDGIDWRIESSEPNPFGLIPAVLLKNKSVGGQYLGRGTCWGAFRMIDKLALTIFLMDKYSQVSSSPHMAILEGDLDNLDPLAPGEPIVVKSGDDDTKRADVKLLEPHGNARVAVSNLLDKLEDHVYKACGVSVLNTAKYANTGQLTAAGLRIQYEDSISTANQRRLLLGNMGMCILFEKMMIGLGNLGVVPALRGYDTSEEVVVDWPEYFSPMATDIMQYAQAYSIEITSGMKTPERCAELMAKAEGLTTEVTNKVVEEVKSARSAIRDPNTNALASPLGSYGEIADAVGNANL